MNSINIMGTSLTGAEGTGRTYTLPSAIAGTPLVQLDNQSLIPTTDYTYNSNTNTITFNVYIINTQYVTIYYNGVPTLNSTIYSSPEYVQAEIRSTTAFSSSTIPTYDSVNRFIFEASKEIDVISNQKYSQVTVTNELHDFSGLQNIFQFPINGLLSVTKVEYNINGAGVAPSWVTLTEGADADYTVYANNNEIQFNGGVNAVLKGLPKFGYQKFRLSYIYGSTDIPYEIQHLCTLMVAKRVISTLINYQANTKQGNIGVGPIRVSDPSNFSMSYLNQMSKDIIQLRHDIGLDTKIYKSSRVYETNIPGYVNGGYYGGGFYG